MEDTKILDLYFARDEQAVKETDRKYGAYCFSLANSILQNKQDAEEAAKILLQKGVQRVFLSMGAEGVYAADETEALWLSNIPGEMVNTTGCGDAFMAALVWAYMQDMDLRDSAKAGLAAASIAMESSETINPAMSAPALKLRMNDE